MEFNILGPVEARIVGLAVDLGTRKTRTLLALLVLHPRECVSIERLADALWPGAPPAHPDAALYSYISRLRAALGDERTRLATHAPGYVLHAGDDEIDARAFERRLAEARVDLARGEVGGAADSLRAGLRLFRGAPLSDVAGVPVLDQEAERLTQLRLDATEHRIDADLALARHGELVPELEALVVAHPLREQFRRQLMLSLYQSGRQVDALRAYESLRRYLADELGVEPAPATRQLEARLLVHDAGLDGHAEAPVPEAMPARASNAMPFPRALAAVRTGPFVGRTASRRWLGGEATAGLMLVAGEPGIGKTRLVAEAAHDEWRAGAAVWFGRCSERRLWPYAPFAEALDAVLDDAATASMLARSPNDLAELSQLIPDLRRRVPGLGSPARVDAGGARYLLFRAVLQVMGLVAETRRLLFVIDDLHWADPDTLALVAYLAEAVRPGHTRVVATARDDELPADHPVVELQRERRLDAIRLRGLAPDEVGMLAAELAPGEVPSRLGDVLHHRTGGNPYFVCELLREHTTGAPETGWSLAPTEGIRAIVQRRLVRLPDVVRRTLEAAAVVGDEFRVDMLVEVVGSDAHGHLDAAAAAGLVRDIGEPGAFAFAHAIIGDVVRDQIGPAARRRLHRLVGEAIEATATTDDDRDLTALVHHLGEADSAAARSRAVEYARVAMGRAMRRYAYEDAARHAEAAIALLRSDPADNANLEAEMLVELATARWRAGRRSDALAAARHGTERARAGSDPIVFGRAAHLCVPPRPDRAVVPLLEEAVDRLGDRDAALRAALLVDLAWQLAETDERARADALLDEGRAQAVDLGVLDAIARALEYDWEWRTMDSTPADRLRAANDLLAAAEDAGDDRVALLAHTQRAIAMLELGDLPAAEESIAAHGRLAGESRMPEFLAANAQRRCMRALLRGGFEEAEACANESLLHLPGDPSFVPIYGGQLAAIRIEQGRPEGMVELLEADAVNRDRPIVRAGRALFHGMSGQEDEARRVLDGLRREGFDAIPRTMFWLVTMALLAEVTVLLDDEGAGADVEARLRPYAGRQVTFGYCAVCWGAVDRFLAPLAFMLGRAHDAVRDYERSLAVHERIGAAPFLARDRIGLARVLLATGWDPERAQRLAVEGLAEADRLGLRGLLRRSEDLATTSN